MIRAIVFAAALACGLASAAVAEDPGDADPLERKTAGPATIIKASYAPLKLTITPMAAPVEVDPDLSPSIRPVARPEYLMTPRPPKTLARASDIECLAVAIYHEARGESDYGQRAVASVIVQRAAVPHRWGDTPCDVIVPVQFSFMNKDGSYAAIDDMKSWSEALEIASHVLATGPMPELRGADHYHTFEVSPTWAPKMIRVRQIEAHIFYADPDSNRSS